MSEVKPVNTNDLRDYADRIGNPYAQFVIDAANELDDTRTERNILRAELDAAREETAASENECAMWQGKAERLGERLQFLELECEAELYAAREELREAEAANTALKDLCLAAGDLYKGGGVFPIKGAMALRLLKAGAVTLKEKP